VGGGVDVDVCVCSTYRVWVGMHSVKPLQSAPNSPGTPPKYDEGIARQWCSSMLWSGVGHEGVVLVQPFPWRYQPPLSWGTNQPITLLPSM